MLINSIKLAEKVRVQSVKMVTEAGASHIASALSIADILSVIYSDFIFDIGKEGIKEEKGKFILSKGHACVALYSLLAELNFFSKKLLKTYGQDFSILMNHVSHKVPGVDFSTGSLGHGLPFGVGKALAFKKKEKKLQVYVLMSDGELQEGSNWEAIMFSAFHQLGNLIAIIDYNNLQSITTVDKTLSLEPLSEKFKAFGWKVFEVDGHNHESLYQALDRAYSVKVPCCIIAHTTKGKGISFMENKVEWHYKSPSIDQLKSALRELEE